MVPSWVIRPEHKNSDGSFSEPVVVRNSLFAKKLPFSIYYDFAAGVHVDLVLFLYNGLLSKFRSVKKIFY